MENFKNDSNFLVALEGIELSAEQIKNIDHGIKEVVMRELAKTDNLGDTIISNRFDKYLTEKRIPNFPILAGIFTKHMSKYLKDHISILNDIKERHER